MENGQMPPGQGGMQQNIDWTQADDLSCDECGSKYFKQSMMYKKVSKFMTGGDRDTLVPIGVIRCDECGHVNDELKPQLPGQ